jgi:hypothetical protein
MLAQLIEETRDVCRETLNQHNLLTVQDELSKRGITDGEVLSLVRLTDESGQSQELLRNLRNSLPDTLHEGSFERYLILRSALACLDKLCGFPTPLRVKQLLCDEFKLFAQPDHAVPLFRLGDYRFVAMCKTASLRRFPAGQIDWEVSGLPRSILLRAPLSTASRLLYFVLGRLQGFKPLFTSHLANRRAMRRLLLASEMNKSYHHIAEAMKLQPRIKGFYASSWLYSPDTAEISPHLRWLSQIFLDNGGLVVNLGPAPLDCGVFERSPERRKAYQEGRFKPTLGLVLWPRREMIRWADEHPELEDSGHG